jgi:hypothetical protein
MIDPFAAVAALCALLWLWGAYRTERDQSNDFSFLRMLKDDNGKESILRLITPFAWVITTVVLLYVVRHDDPEDLQFFLWYLAFWSGAPVAGKALETAAKIWGRA